MWSYMTRMNPYRTTPLLRRVVPYLSLAARCVEPMPPARELPAHVRVWRAVLYVEAWLIFTLWCLSKVRWPRRTCYALPSRTGGADHSFHAHLRGSPMVFGGSLGRSVRCAAGRDPWGREDSDVRAVSIVRRAVYAEDPVGDGSTRQVEDGWYVRSRTCDFDIGDDTCPGHT